MGDFGKRLLSALVIGPLVVLLSAFFCRQNCCSYSWGACLRRPHTSSRRWRRRPDRKTLTVLAVLTPAPRIWAWRSTLCGFFCRLLPISRSGWRAPDVGDASMNREIGRAVAVLTAAEVFLALPLFFLCRLKEIDPLAPLALVLTIWASDTAAYLVGKSVGRHKLAPLISPKKTYEGLAGRACGSGCRYAPVQEDWMAWRRLLRSAWGASSAFSGNWGTYSNRLRKGCAR